MAQLKASRTLLKSSPELWAECSDAASLARHLGAFGEIRITKLEPETAVAWEGEDVRGTVTLEPSGWGTRVILTAVPAAGRASGPPAEDAPAREPEPETAEPETAEPEAIAPEAETIEPETAEPEPIAPEAAEPEAETIESETAEPEPVEIATEAPEGATEPEPDPEPALELRKPGFFARLFGRRPRPEPAAETGAGAETGSGAETGLASETGVAAETPVAAEPEAPAELEASEPEPGVLETAASEVSAGPAPAPAQPAAVAPAPDADADPAQALVVALESLGKAHRRPFSHG